MSVEIFGDALWMGAVAMGIAHGSDGRCLSAEMQEIDPITIDHKWIASSARCLVSQSLHDSGAKVDMH